MNFSVVGFVCEASDEKWTYLILMPLSVLAGLVNVVVWLAATFYRKKLLRQSYVYSCVTSTLLSNVMFLSFHLWDEVESFTRPDHVSMSPPNGKIQVLWSLCRSAPLSLLFVMCGDLSVLIYVMLDSTYFQKPNRKRRSFTSGRRTGGAPTSAFEAKRKRATCLLFFTWLLPLVLTIAAVLTWNCADVCHCSPGARGEICPRDHGCSRTWMPMKNSFIAVNIALWFVEVASLICVTFTGIINFQTYNAKSTGSMKSAINPPYKQEVLPRAPGCRDSLSSVATSTFTEIEKSQHGIKISEGDVAKDICNRRRHFKINPRLRLVTILSAVFVVCTVLVPIIFFLDVGFSPDLPELPALRISSMVLVQLYTLLCPILLVKYMTNLKSSLNVCASTLCHCTSK